MSNAVASADYALPLAVRLARKEDLGFIYSSWMNSLRNCSPWSRVDKNWFFAAQHALATRLMERSVVLVACSVRNPDQLYGYVVAEPTKGILHWLYTKSGVNPGLSSRAKAKAGYRRAGVATRLMHAAFPDLGDEPITVTTRTPSSAHLPMEWMLSFDTHQLCQVTA
jgi:hypothetical protein